MPALPRLYADFNAIEFLDGGKENATLALTGYGTLMSLASQNLRLVEGMRAIFYEPNDIECEGVVFFDTKRTDPSGRQGEWVARINAKNISDFVGTETMPNAHPCFNCGADLRANAVGGYHSFTECCSICGTSVMAPMAPPENAT